MEMAKNNGGPAFPEIGNVAYNSDWQNEGGMSLRDWFAGQYMAGVLGGEVGSHLRSDVLARDAYAYADAMIAERDK
jgi:hypothetical protein